MAVCAQAQTITLLIILKTFMWRKVFVTDSGNLSIELYECEFYDSQPKAVRVRTRGHVRVRKH